MVLGLGLGFGPGSVTAAPGDSPRVISLAPHLTELAFAAGVGDRLVGVVDYSDFPARAAELPSIGDAFRFDLERIMALEPDLALAWRGGTPTRTVDRLQDIDIDVLWVETRSLSDIADALALIGRRLGDRGQGQAAAQDFRETLSRHEGPGGESLVRVFYQVSPQPLYTLGGRHVINEVFEACGLVNVFADLDTEAAVVDFEAVLATEPDWIIAGRGSNHQDALAQWRDSGLIDLDQTRLHAVEPELLVRPTPRILEGIDHLCRLRQDHPD